MTLAILNSPKLTELIQKGQTVSAKAKALQTEVHRLSKLQHPTSWVDATVVRVTDVDVPSAAFVGIKPRPDQASVIATGTGEQDHAAREQDAVRRVLAGESITNVPSNKEQLETVRREWGATEAAIEFLNREIERERDTLAVQFTKSFKPTHDKQMTALGASALDFYAKYAEAYDGKRHLIDSGVGLRDGLYHNLPQSFLSAPNNPWSDMAAWFTEAKRQGFIKEVPAPLRMKVAK